MKKIEKQTIANYLHNLRVAYSGGKTLREFCKEHNFDASLWSMLENGLWHEFTTEEIIEKYPPLFPNQEVSQPEETVVSGSYSTKDIHVSEEYLNTTNYQDCPKTSTTTNKVENNTEEINRPEILKDIVHKIIRDNDLELATEQIVDLLVANKKEKDSSLDNTEEWSDEQIRIRNIMQQYGIEEKWIDESFGLIWGIIEKILSERSFSKEERYAIEDVFCSAIGAGYKLDSIAEKVRTKNWKLIDY